MFKSTKEIIKKRLCSRLFL